MNRNHTIVTLDELKQRLSIRLPIERRLGGGSEPPASTRSLLAADQVGGRHNTNPANLVPLDYIPAAVALSLRQSTGSASHGPNDCSRSLSTSNGLDQSRSSRPSTETYYNQPYQHLLSERGTNPEIMNQEIDEIMDSYQGLYIARNASDSWDHPTYSRGPMGRHDSATDAHIQDTFKPLRETRRASQVLPSTSEEHDPRYQPQRPTFNNSMPTQYQEQPSYQTYPARNPYPQMQMRSQHNDSRLSTSSATSSAYSGSPSLGRNSSTSSQESHAQNSAPPHNQYYWDRRNQSSPEVPSQYQNNCPTSQVLAPSLATPESYRSVAPLSPQPQRRQSSSSPTSPPSFTAPTQTTVSPADPNSLMYSPFASPYPQFESHSGAAFSVPHQQAQTMPAHRTESAMSSPPQYDPWPATARSALSTPSTMSERTITQPVSSASTLGTTSAITTLRHRSIAPSIASTDSSSSIAVGILSGSRISRVLRTQTIQNGSGSEKMMDGRPCKANNYWGFCKGSWTIREDQKKGLTLRVQPSGMFNNREVWECSSCSFQGRVFSTPHPSKKGKTVNVVDPSIQVSRSGVRYKWICKSLIHPSGGG